MKLNSTSNVRRSPLKETLDEEHLLPTPFNGLAIQLKSRKYECKVQNLKKRKVTIHVSVNGVRVVLKKRRRKKKNWSNEADEIELLNHPIYRIFYVSHDSSDLKIFSYIARDASTDTFKCSVFKSHKKNHCRGTH
uniref:PID domain-containing protein n=1 Tax=Glossina austeni TaxID=7395 RepID=A0A1A9UG07_GLOAU